MLSYEIGRLPMQRLLSGPLFPSVEYDIEKDRGLQTVSYLEKEFTKERILADEEEMSKKVCLQSQPQPQPQPQQLRPNVPRVSPKWEYEQ